MTTGSQRPAVAAPLKHPKPHRKLRDCNQGTKGLEVEDTSGRQDPLLKAYKEKTQSRGLIGFGASECNRRKDRCALDQLQHAPRSYESQVPNRQGHVTLVIPGIFIESKEPPLSGPDRH